MRDDVAFVVFVVLFCGGLGALTLAMLFAAVQLFRKRRRRSS